MLRIRLSRIGKKGQPNYRVILSPKGTPPRGGKFLEILGQYNPKLKTISLNKERISYWFSVGAQPSTTVYNLLVKEGVIKGPKRKIKIPSSAKASTDDKSLADKSEGEPKSTEKAEEKIEEKVEEAVQTIDKPEEPSKIENGNSGA